MTRRHKGNSSLAPLLALALLACPGDDDDSVAADDDDSVESDDDDDDSGEPVDPCLGVDRGSVEACPAVDCEAILAAGETEDGTYWVEGDGSWRAFEVGCDMTTEPGGWLRLSLEDSDHLLVGSNSVSNPWLKCADSVVSHYDWLTDEAAVEMDYAPSAGFQEAVEPTFRDTITDTVLSSRAIDALRPAIQDLHLDTRMVATTNDDDGHSWQDGSGSGMEVYVVGTDGEWILLTPGTNGECGGGEWPAEDSRSAFYLWSTWAARSETDGDVGEDPVTLGALPAAGILPRAVHLAVYTGGGVSFGWETEVFLVR